MASCPREETSFSRRSWPLAWAGLVRMACWNVSGSVPQRGQVRFGSSWNPEGWAARLLFADHIWWILPATNFPRPMEGCGVREGGYS